MVGLNRVQLIGYLGRDPETRRTNNGAPIVNLRIATSETWRDKQTGERRDRTEWHSVVIFNENLCKVAGQYLRKGSLVYVEGKLETRKWQDQSGVDRYSTEVVLRFDGKIQMLDRRNGAEAGSGSRNGDVFDGGVADDWQAPAPAARSPAGSSAPSNKTLAEELDDDIPF
jgi:single-strand DNA-binding protein